MLMMIVNQRGSAVISRQASGACHSASQGPGIHTLGTMQLGFLNVIVLDIPPCDAVMGCLKLLAGMWQ